MQSRRVSVYSYYRYTLLCLSGCLVLGLATTAMAAASDQSAPMKLEANAASNNDLQGLSILSGNVRVEKGSLRLRGERIEVRQDPLGYQKAQILGAGASRAYFRQARDVAAGEPPEYWEGEAQKIDYDSQTALVKLTGNAHLKRYRAGKLVDEAKGENMVYDDLNDTFDLRGAPNGATKQSVTGTSSTRQQDGSRVQIILGPSK